MLRYPLLNLWMLNIGCLFLDRKDLKAGLKTILEAIGEIKKGNSLVIYPEGTRNRNEDGFSLLEFKEGSMKIAEKAKCLILPMAELGSASVFEKHIPFIRPATVVIRFGKPCRIAELPEEYRKRSALYMRGEIERMLREMQAAHPEVEM